MPTPSPRRLSIFLPTLEGAGAERSMAALADGLAARGHELHLVLARATGPYREQLSKAVHVVDLGRDTVVGAIPGLAAHLRQVRPHALLAAMAHANIAAVVAHRLARSGARLVLSEHAHLSSVLQTHRGWRMAATQHLMAWLYPRADRIVAVSDGVADDLSTRLRLPRTGITTVYNPVVEPSMLARAQEPVRHRWLQTREVPVIVSAGRLTAQKDYRTLIDAFARLRQARPARLLIVGEGELRAPLQQQVQALGLQDHVDLPGFEPNPYPTMRAADLFVVSSIFEGLSCVLIEAMACGARVVSTDCPSGPAEVLEGGRWGRLVPVADAAALAAAMAAALDDAQAPDVRRRAADFSVDRAVDLYADVLAGD